jgi:oxygen-dependent protoporphyrinogen oxidase
MTTFIGGMRQPALVNRDDRDLQRLVLDDLRNLLGVSDAPDFIYIRRYQRAIPQYMLGHQRFLDLMSETEQEFPGVHFAANYRGGVSVADCIKQAREMATAIRVELKTKEQMPKAQML